MATAPNQFLKTQWWRSYNWKKVNSYTTPQSQINYKSIPLLIIIGQLYCYSLSFYLKSETFLVKHASEIGTLIFVSKNCRACRGSADGCGRVEVILPSEPVTASLRPSENRHTFPFSSFSLSLIPSSIPSLPPPQNQQHLACDWVL